MMRKRSSIGFFALLLICVATATVALGDKLVLKDGTVLEGKVIKNSDQYWVKTADGDSRIVPATDVASYVKTPPPSAKPPTTPGPKSKTPPAKTPTPATPPKEVAPPAPVAPPPPQVTVSVPATHIHSNAVATGVKLAMGQQFILNPDPKDMWGKGDGPSKGKKCDFKGFTERPGWMSLGCKVGGSGVAFEAGKPAEAPEAGELFLSCTDDTNPAKNVGEIHVTIIGPLPPSIAFIQKQIEGADKISAVLGILNGYLAMHPADPDLSQAKAELSKWTAMGEGEKINGKWVTGAEHKALLAQANTLVKDAMELFQKNSTLQAMKKMEEAQALYPNSFFVNFLLGYMAFSTDDMDKAMPLFQRAAQIRPKSPEALANIGAIHFKKKDYERGMTELMQAAEWGDSPEIAIDLNVMVHTANDDLKKSPKFKDAESAAKILAAKYGMPAEIWRVGIRPVEMMESADGEPPPGSKASGTGFFITDDGLILTNRHVAKGGKSFEITLQGGEKLPGEVVVIDDEQDLALLRIKPTKPVHPVKFAERDAPADGADCTVIGFPLGDRYTTNPKVTHGIVTSGHINTDGADVMIEAKVNPGNSGGPILDKSGDVMAIVCMKSISTEMEDSYGLGIGAGKIRKFLAKNNIKTTTASGKATTLSAEEIASKVEPMTVLIVTTH
ncbi:MAG TPA: trypsin-like peptidase domain-containing protein [Tepidisphaeraceae bacterium]|jgi:S1-C subfamily serine protease|nr:trypsin-like peptidase domain-containing protein [Tepidisphaeraceae bacterium]